MDPSSFDRLSRLLARATTRRGAIAAVVAGLAGAVGVDQAAAIPQQCTAGGATCTKHSQCCSGTCRLVGGGGVRRVCDCEAGTARCGGRCVRIDTAERCGSCNVSCKAGEECCGGRCRAVKSDENNCGACGNVCAAGETCCKGVCVDLETSKGNCGACGKACTGSKICCDGTCVAVKTDEANCGACGIVCADGQTCCGGACADLTSDDANCGACRKQCPADLSCNDGVCNCGGEICTDGLTCDNGVCNCGGETCAAEWGCTNDVCTCDGQPSCANGETCCGDTCVDTDSDDNHCGACNVKCTGGKSCHFGVCMSACVAQATGTCSAGTSCLVDMAGNVEYSMYVDATGGNGCAAPGAPPCPTNFVCRAGMGWVGGFGWNTATNGSCVRNVSPCTPA